MRKAEQAPHRPGVQNHPEHASLSTGHTYNRTGLGKPGAGDAGRGAAIWGTTCDCSRTLAWGWEAAGPFISSSKAKWEPLAAPPSHARFTDQFLPALLPQTFPFPPPLCHPAPRHKCALRGSQRDVFPHGTAWLGRCSSRLIYSQAPRPHTLQRCLPRLPALPATGAFQSVSIFIPKPWG